MDGLIQEMQALIEDLIGSPVSDCQFCNCWSGFHEDGVCSNCQDEGTSCPGYEAMEADFDE